MEILEGIVRAIVGAPADEALEVATLVKVALENSRQAGTFSASNWRSSTAQRGVGIGVSTWIVTSAAMHGRLKEQSVAMANVATLLTVRPDSREFVGRLLLR
jgi:hypothetical protein